MRLEAPALDSPSHLGLTGNSPEVKIKGGMERARCSVAGLQPKSTLEADAGGLHEFKSSLGKKRGGCLGSPIGSCVNCRFQRSSHTTTVARLLWNFKRWSMGSLFFLFLIILPVPSVEEEDFLPSSTYLPDPWPWIESLQLLPSVGQTARKAKCPVRRTGGQRGVFYVSLTMHLTWEALPLSEVWSDF